MSPRTQQRPTSSAYPPILEDEFAISAYITEQSPSDVDEDLIEEYFCGAHGVLCEVPLADLEPGSLENNLPSPAKERRYARMDPNTMPPLVVEDGVVIDGNHRYRVLLARGAKTAWCYEIKDDSCPFDRDCVVQHYALTRQGDPADGNSYCEQHA